MASKLTSSLRKSISAEQESVEKKAVGGVRKAPTRKPAATKNSQTATAKTTATAAVVEKPVASEPVKQAAVAIEVETSSDPLDFLAGLKELSSGLIGKFELADFNNYSQGWGLVQEAIEKITATNHEVLSSCLDNLVEVNDEISDYVKSLLEAREPNEIYQLNVDFIKILQQKQQELFSKNLAVFNHFSGWKF